MFNQRRSILVQLIHRNLDLEMKYVLKKYAVLALESWQWVSISSECYLCLSVHKCNRFIELNKIWTLFVCVPNGIKDSTYRSGKNK